MGNAQRLTFVLLLGAMFATLFVLMQRPWQAGASVTVGNEYTATSTGIQTGFPNYRNAFINDYRPGYGTTTPGTLGSVVITTPGTSRFCLYDATSTATNVDTAYGPTGTTTIACFGASAAVGTYTFDVAVRKGVLVEYLSADTVGWASTTITLRK